MEEMFNIFKHLNGKAYLKEILKSFEELELDKN